MLRTVLSLTLICGLVKSSGVGVAPLPLAGSIPPLANAPVVTAASSQYFERTFNRLVVPPVVAPVASVVPPPLAPVIPLPPAPTVFVEPTRNVPVVVNTQPSSPPRQPDQPNIAIAVATAHAAAPVATILLPPYPFGFPPTFGFIPSEQPTNNPDENTKEPTTQKSTEKEATTTPEPAIVPVDASNSDNNVVQALPSNEDINFNLYGPPPQGSRPQFQPLPQPQAPNGQFQPQIPNQQKPNPQFQPHQPNPQFQIQQPNLQFQPQRPNPQFQPQQPNLQFQPQQPNLQFQPQQPNPRFQPQQPNLQFQPQRPNLQFQPQRPNPQLQPQQPNPQFQSQQPEFPPYPPHQQPQLQIQPHQRPLQSKQQHWNKPKGRPQKLKTSVEVVPVPLAYITPPPIHKTHSHVKILKHIYSYAPASSPKIILKHVKVHPVRLVRHKVVGVRLQNLRANDRDIEITTVNPFRKPNTKPPRV
ncbi:unnamed protein product [Arctia plantaginis]|uniref:Uncharacterized protein n=1 Tax=Arctia plantaginis TaxID=874455 RepID=A0A8S1BL28_ARCPL|nr:unnamed protein product [Arctia plantaginis]